MTRAARASLAQPAVLASASCPWYCCAAEADKVGVDDDDRDAGTDDKDGNGGGDGDNVYGGDGDVGDGDNVYGGDGDGAVREGN